MVFCFLDGGGVSTIFPLPLSPGAICREGLQGRAGSLISTPFSLGVVGLIEVGDSRGVSGIRGVPTWFVGLFLFFLSSWSLVLLRDLLRMSSDSLGMVLAECTKTQC